MSKNQNEKIIHNLLDTFQEVLNWCYEIEDDESRLPLDLLNKSHEVINAATIEFQPEKVLQPFNVVWANWNKSGCEGGCNGDSDVCACAVLFACQQCGRKVVAVGEDMPVYANVGGKCENCGQDNR